MLIHPPEDCIGTVTEFFALVHHPTVKSNEFCQNLLQLLSLGIPSTIQEINSVPFSSPTILAMHITTCHLQFDFMSPYSTVPQHKLTLKYALSGFTVLLNKLNNESHALMNLRNQQIRVSYFTSVYDRTSTQGLHANTQLSQISFFKIDSTVFLLMPRFFHYFLACWCFVCIIA